MLWKDPVRTDWINATRGQDAVHTIFASRIIPVCESTTSEPTSSTKNSEIPYMTLWLLTQLLQEVVNEVEEAGDRVLGLSRIDLGLLSSLRGLWGKG